MDVSPVVEAPNTRRSTSSSSQEFDFWMFGNHPSSPNLYLTADDLFLDGVILPLHLLTLTPTPTPTPSTEPKPDPSPASIFSDSAGPAPTSTSKRWKDIFTLGDKKPDNEKQHRKDRKTASELNINLNIWPFSRSRSARTGGRPRPAAARKASSAPCSRSNSRGESGKPGRAYLGRTSPVRQIRRVSKCEESDGVTAGAVTGNGSLFNLRGLFSKKVY